MPRECVHHVPVHPFTMSPVYTGPLRGWLAGGTRAERGKKRLPGASVPASPRPRYPDRHRVCFRSDSRHRPNRGVYSNSDQRKIGPPSARGRLPPEPAATIRAAAGIREPSPSGNGNRASAGTVLLRVLYRDPYTLDLIVDHPTRQHCTSVDARLCGSAECLRRPGSCRRRP